MASYLNCSSLEIMDLFAAAMSETPAQDGFLGPTFTCLIREQFRELKEGDRFYYRHRESGFTPGKHHVHLHNYIICLGRFLYKPYV